MIKRYSELEKTFEYAWLTYYERYDDELSKIVHEALKATPGQRVQWDLIPKNLLIKTWSDFVKLGFVRHEKAIELMTEKILNNTAQLQVLTELMGHSNIDGIVEAQDRFELTDEETEELRDKFENSSYAEFEDGSWMLSDYGLPQVLKKIPALINAKTAEEKLVLIDQILNIVHQRSDFALFYVEGGVATLNLLAGK